MNKYISYSFALCFVLMLAACSEKEQIKPIELKPKITQEYISSISAQEAAKLLPTKTNNTRCINFFLDGKQINEESGIDVDFKGEWMSLNGTGQAPHQIATLIQAVSYQFSFSRKAKNETEKNQSIAISLPAILIADPYNTIASYNYQAMKDFYTVGKKDFRVKGTANYQYYGHQIDSYFSDFDYKNANGHSSLDGSQSTSTIEIVSVTELPQQTLCVKYFVNVKLYPSAMNSTDNNVRQLTGIIQVPLKYVKLKW